jgi:hypothetical protein
MTPAQSPIRILVELVSPFPPPLSTFTTRHSTRHHSRSRPRSFTHRTSATSFALSGPHRISFISIIHLMPSHSNLRTASHSHSFHPISFGPTFSLSSHSFLLHSFQVIYIVYIHVIESHIIPPPVDQFITCPLISSAVDTHPMHPICPILFKITQLTRRLNRLHHAIS